MVGRFADAAIAMPKPGTQRSGSSRDAKDDGCDTEDDHGDGRREPALPRKTDHHARQRRRCREQSADAVIARPKQQPERCECDCGNNRHELCRQLRGKSGAAAFTHQEHRGCGLDQPVPLRRSQNQGDQVKAPMMQIAQVTERRASVAVNGVKRIRTCRPAVPEPGTDPGNEINLGRSGTTVLAWLHNLQTS